VALVAIAERRVLPGQAPIYLAALRAVSQTLAFADVRGELRALVDDADPDHLLVTGRWSARADHERAMARMPAALTAAALGPAAALEEPPRWYRIDHEIERIDLRPAYVVVRRYTVGPELQLPFERWVVDLMRDLVRLPGVVSQALLVELDDPSRVVSLVHYTGAEAAAEVSRRVNSHPRPPELSGLGSERFAGRTDLLWEPSIVGR
jgi:hypothetical protein